MESDHLEPGFSKFQIAKEEKETYLKVAACVGRSWIREAVQWSANARVLRYLNYFAQVSVEITQNSPAFNSKFNTGTLN